MRDFQNLIMSLNRFGRMLPAVVDGLSESDAKWKPDENSWSILEVVCHLADEEVEDFRLRLKMTLSDPKQEWPPIDPEGVAIERKYNEQNLVAVTQRFTKERSDSIQWLESLQNPDWELAFDHPQYGPLSAGLLMVSWAAHDQLHLRQIAKRMFEMNQRDGAPFSTKYAGDWKA